MLNIFSYLAVATRSGAMVSFFLENLFSISQDINSKDKEGKTPLMHAASRRWVWLDLITLVLNS